MLLGLVVAVLALLPHARATFSCNSKGDCAEVNDQTGYDPRFKCTTDGRYCTTNGPDPDEGKRLSVTGKELKDKALRMLFEVWAGNDFANVDQFVSSSHVLTSSHLARPLVGHDGLKDYNSHMLTSFLDYSFIVDDILQEGNKVVLRFQFFGTHTGDYEGFPATGRFVRVRDCVCVFDFWNGKIQQTLLVWPQSNLLKQLSQEPTVAIKGPTISGDMESSPKLRGP